MPLAAACKVAPKSPSGPRPSSIKSTVPSAARRPTSLSGRARCACGGGCPRCREAGLSISEPGNPLEREAQRMADQVPAAPARFEAGGAQSHAGPRKASKAPPSAWPAFAAPLAASSGRALDPLLRAEMGRHFGHDFSHVRVHTDAQAGHAAHDAGARAFTVGPDVVFGAGQFAPGTQAGRRLIAHELAHVVQQQGGETASGSAGPTGAKPGSAAHPLAAAGRPLAVRLAASVGMQRDQDPALPQPPRGTGAYAAWLGESLVAIDVGTDWPSEQVRTRFIQEYLAYTRSNARRRKLYEEAAKDYPQAAELERRFRRHGAAFGTRKRIRVVEVLVPETKFGSPVGSFGSRMFSQAEPIASYETEVDEPDPSAGFNFDTYILNVSTGQRIAAKHLGGERFRVFMGSEKCPGCHFGHGLEVEFHGESFVLALAPQILGAASVMGRMSLGRTAPPPVADADVVAAHARNPASLRPQNPQLHQQDWQGRGGVGKAPTAYRDGDGAIRLSTDSWLLKPATRAGIPPVSPTGSAPAPRPAMPAPARPVGPADRVSGTADTGRAPVSPPADPLAQTPAMPAPAAPAKPLPAQVVAPDAPTGAAIAESRRPQAPVARRQIDPPQPISEPAVREIQNRPRPAQPAHKGQGSNVLYTQSAESHQLAWQRVGGHGPAPPAFTYDGQVYLDPSRWPPRR
jgi:hypothetical protein